MFITINDTRETRHHHPEPVVYRTVHSCCCMFCGCWQMDHDMSSIKWSHRKCLCTRPPNPPCSAYLSLLPRTPGSRQSFHCLDSFAFSRTFRVSHCDQSALSKTLTFSSTPRFSVVLRVRAEHCWSGTQWDVQNLSFHGDVCVSVCVCARASQQTVKLAGNDMSSCSMRYHEMIQW